MSQLELAMRKARADDTGKEVSPGDAHERSARAASGVRAGVGLRGRGRSPPARCRRDRRLAGAAATGIAGGAAIGNAEFGRAAAERRSRAAVPDFSPAYRDKLAMGEQSRPEIREQFRKIAAALYRVREQRPIKVVMVVSAVPGEGKTLTAVNLALTLSESYKSKVLLVDADLRRPSVHLVFDLPNTAGLKERLVAEVDELLPTPVSPIWRC